jgi:hypothetical protein
MLGNAIWEAAATEVMIATGRGRQELEEFTARRAAVTGARRPERRAGATRAASPPA